MDGKYNALKLENQLCFPLYAASREVIKKYRPYLDPLDLTYTQYLIMMVVWEKSTVDVRELCKSLFLDSGTLTPVLKSMESKGLISRYRSREDERVLTVSVTDKGMALRDRALSVPSALVECIRLEPQEAVQLHALLYKLLGAASEE